MEVLSISASLRYPNPVLQVTEQELQSTSEEQRTEFLRGRIFPEHHRSDTQPETEQLGSWDVKWKPTAIPVSVVSNLCKQLRVFK